MTARVALALGAALALLAAPARADFVARGTFRYVDRPFSYGGGFAPGETELPIRLAFVQVLNAANGSVLATGSTGLDGAFSIPVPGSGTSDIEVRCRSQSFTFQNQLRATDAGNSLYVVTSPVFPSWNKNVDLDVGVVVAQKVTSGGFVGGPFNMLDQLVSALQYVQAHGVGGPPQQMRIEWPAGSTSFASGSVANMADDDGFDDTVQLHEIGHVVHNLYSNSDSPGGAHFIPDSDQDPRLSYGEGYATFFAAAVRQFQGVSDPGIYVDCDGNGSTGFGSLQLRLRLENGNPFGSNIRGEADEAAVACALWDVVDTAATDDGSAGNDDDAIDGSFLFDSGLTGDAVQWKVFDGSPVAGAQNLTIRNNFEGFFAPTDHGRYAELSSVFDGWGMRFTLDGAEPNDTILAPAQYTPTTSWGPVRTLYASSASPPSPGTGDNDVYAFFVASGSVFDVETRYPGGAADADTYADTFLVLRRPNGTIVAQTESGGDGRNAALLGVTADATGTWSAEVRTQHSYRRTGSYEFRARVTFEAPTPPVIANVSPAQVLAVTVDGPPVVTLTGGGFVVGTTVTIGGVAVTPTLVGQSTLRFDMPLVFATGAVPIVVTNQAGSANETITVMLNEPPVVDVENSEPFFLLSTLGATITLGGTPGDVMLLVVSPHLIPSVVPGLYSLGIGNGSTTLLNVWTTFIPSSGWAQQTFPFPTAPFGTKIYVQGLRYDGSFPLDATNVQTGTIAF